MAVIKVFDRLPSVGDALFLVSGVKTWVRYSEAAPSGGTFVGVVFHRDGHKVYVANKTESSEGMYYKDNTAISDGSRYSSSAGYLRKDGSISKNRGMINLTRALAYWKTGGRTPTQNETIPSATDSDPVTKSAFESSAYCKILRQTYNSYESYLMEGLGVKFPQEYGCFGLPDGKTITYELNDSNHPAFQYCTSLTYKYNNVDVDGVGAGDWYLPGVYEGTVLFRKSTIDIINPTITKFGGNEIGASNYDFWLAQKYGENDVWYFAGRTRGHLHHVQPKADFHVLPVTWIIV